MFRISLFIAALFFATPAMARQDAVWLRHPAISPDGSMLVFTYRGDLYRVPVSGGVATRLTAHPAHDFMPVWSRDGRSIAFASDRYGNFDVFVVPAAGGEPRRLTVHGADEYPYSFSADGGSVIYGSARLDAAESRVYPSGAQPELYQVPVDGGRPVQLLTTPAEAVAVSGDGRLLAYEDRKGQENAWRKHHRSSVARDLWVYDVESGAHRRLTTFEGEDRNPVFGSGDSTIYYLSEESGSFNVHRIPVTGGESVQLTRFEGGPVRFLSRAENGTLAFAHGGHLYTMSEGGEPGRVPVTIVGDAAVNNERVITFSGGVREAVLSPNGKEVAFIHRGDIFVASVSGGTTKQVTRTPEVETGVAFSPDGKSLIYASERDGRWGIHEARRVREEEPYFFASTLIEETPVIVNGHQNFQPRYSPDGKELAYIEDFTNLRVLDLATGATRTLLTENEIFGTGPGHRFEWSPDGEWILFEYRVPGIAPREIGLVRAAGGEPAINLTQSGFNDRMPTWILGGKAMLWLSNRDGMRSMAMSGGNQWDAYAIFFTREGWDRFRLSKEDYALLQETEKAAKGEEKEGREEKSSKAEPVVLDLEGVRDRRARLTIHSSAMGGALVSRDGETLYYLARFEKGMNLWRTNLRTKETKQILALDARSARMAWDAEQKKIFLSADGGLSLVDPSSGKRERIAIRGEMVVDEAAEREAIFDRVWRRTRDTFYTEGHHGTDWEALGREYRGYLGGVSNGHEYAELLSEMLGELNVSHSGARYSSRTAEGDETASLGIFPDYAHRDAGVKVVEVMAGGPLDRPGMDVKPGAIITAIDGVEIGPDLDFAALLNRKAGKNVLLSIRDPGARSERQIVVKPITPREESQLLYRRWVRRNEEEVDRLSNGRLGYIHVPGMNDGAYRNTFEEVMGKFPHREGLVVDVRWNGGGDLVADLAMFLSGKKFFDYSTDTRSTGFEPNFRWTKPSVTITNEAAYSDGHCFSWAYQHLGIGPLIGQAVPGTCTFAGWELLQNGVRWGVPGLGVKDADSGRYLENWQTEVDIPVWNDYQSIGRGVDPQLEAAVKALLERIGTQVAEAGR